MSSITMPRVVVYANDGSVENEILVSKDEFSVGRNRSSDVQIRDGSISSKHASVKVCADRFVITDLGSTNGMCVNNQRVEQAEVADGEAVQLGTRQVAFFHSLISPEKQNLSDSVVYKSTAILPVGAPNTGDELVLIDGSGPPSLPGSSVEIPQRLRLVDLPLLVGSGAHCTCRLPCPELAAEHARLTRNQTRFHVLSLDPEHPVLVNGQPVLQSVLSQQDVVQLGGYQFRVQRIGEQSSARLPAYDPNAAHPPTTIVVRRDLARRLRRQAQRTRWALVLMGCGALVACLVYLRTFVPQVP
jgi:pSer/pThr/pTyr-binding forkhead associated (FHA) protein